MEKYVWMVIEECYNDNKGYCETEISIFKDFHKAKQYKKDRLQIFNNIGLCNKCVNRILNEDDIYNDSNNTISSINVNNSYILTDEKENKTITITNTNENNSCITFNKEDINNVCDNYNDFENSIIENKTISTSDDDNTYILSDEEENYNDFENKKKLISDDGLCILSDMEENNKLSISDDDNSCILSDLIENNKKCYNYNNYKNKVIKNKTIFTSDEENNNVCDCEYEDFRGFLIDLEKIPIDGMQDKYGRIYVKYS